MPAARSGQTLRLLTLLFFAGTLLLGLVVPSSLYAKEALRVVILRNSPPLQFYDNVKFRASGFAVDVFNHVAEQVDLEPSYLLADTWSEMISLVLDGRADVAASLAISKTRLQQLAFSEVIHSSQISLFVRSQNNQISGLAPGLRIGSTEGSIVVDYLRQQAEVSTHLYKTIPEAVFALLAGRTDALVAGEWLVLKEARDAGIEDRLKIVGQPLISIKRAMAVRPDNRALLQKLDLGISALINSPDYRDIYVRWYGKEPATWTAKRVLILMSLLLAVSSLILVAWRMRTAQRLNLALRESERRLRQAMDATSDGLWDWDLEQQQAYFNPNYYRMLGYQPGEFPAGFENWLERVHPDDKEQTLAVIQDYVDNKTDHFEVEYRMRAKDGSWKWILGRGEATSRDQQGRALKMIGTHVDISARKSAETALKSALQDAESARDRVDAILESVGEPLIVTDPEQRLVLMNNAAEELLGQPLFKASGKVISMLIGDPALRQQLSEQTTTGTSTRRVDLELEHQGLGEIRQFQAQSSPVVTRDGTVTGVITLLRDITQEKEIDRLKSEFISIAAHELQTPLASVIGYSELLLNETGDQSFTSEQRREFLGYILQKGETLGRLVEDLLNISRIESGRPLVLERQPCDLVELVSGLVKHHQRETATHHFVVELPDSPLWLNVDRVRIEQVVDNLFNNATKYSPAGGTISVSLQAENGGLLLQVADEGIGMSGEQLQHVFDKFYRANKTDTAVHGLGLGMNIAKNIIEAHGGEIWVESELEHGTRVHVRLPNGPLTETD